MDRWIDWKRDKILYQSQLEIICCSSRTKNRRKLEFLIQRNYQYIQVVHYAQNTMKKVIIVINISIISILLLLIIIIIMKIIMLLWPQEDETHDLSILYLYIWYDSPNLVNMFYFVILIQYPHCQYFLCFLLLSFAEWRGF